MCRACVSFRVQRLAWHGTCINNDSRDYDNDDDNGGTSMWHERGKMKRKIASYNTLLMHGTMHSPTRLRCSLQHKYNFIAIRRIFYFLLLSLQFRVWGADDSCTWTRISLKRKILKLLIDLIMIGLIVIKCLRSGHATQTSSPPTMSSLFCAFDMCARNAMSQNHNLRTE